MFEGLKWGSAARRSAVVIVIYLGLFYVLNVAFPERFGLQSREQVFSLLINAAVFFLVFTFVYAFVGRSRDRRLAEMRKKQGSSSSGASQNAEPGPLKGQANPNTSRKKARRRR